MACPLAYELLENKTPLSMYTVGLLTAWLFYLSLRTLCDSLNI